MFAIGKPSTYTMIAIAIVLITFFCIYYVYDDLSKTKQTVYSLYQKSMAVDAKILYLDKQQNKSIKSIKPSASPAMSITYQSEMVRGMNDTETETKKLLKTLQTQSEKPSQRELNEIIKQLESPSAVATLTPKNNKYINQNTQTNNNINAINVSNDIEDDDIFNSDAIKSLTRSATKIVKTH